MNLAEAASLHGCAKDHLRTCIVDGFAPDGIGPKILLQARALGKDFDIDEQDLDDFFAALERSAPGRHPPLAVRRALRAETDGCCAHCNRRGALEYHHIVEWSKIRHHDADQMIALCPNCHTDVTHLGTPDAKELRLKKAKLRNAGARPPKAMSILDVPATSDGAVRAGTNPHAELAHLRTRTSVRVATTSPGIVQAVTSEGASVVDELVRAIRAGQHVSLIGGSGMGKSHMVGHLAATLASFETTVVVAAARAFDGYLDEWLDAAVAPVTTHSAATVAAMSAMLGERLVLVVDGLNECAESERGAMVGFLEALAVRGAVTLVITAHAHVQWAFPTTSIAVADYPFESKRQIFGLFSGTNVIDDDLVRALRTPFELELAANCYGGLGVAPARFEVVSAFARARLASPRLTGAFQLLTDLAGELVRRLRFAIAPSSLYALARRVLGPERSEGVVRAVLDTGVVVLEQGVVTFRHELLFDYFMAEMLLRSTDATDLPAMLALPRHHAAVPLIFQALAASGDLASALPLSIELRAYFCNAALGEYGAVAERVASNEMHRLTHAAIAALKDIRLTVDPGSVPDEGVRGSLPVRSFEQSRQWSEYENHVFRTIGELANHLKLFELAKLLVGRTDEYIDALASSTRLRRQVRSEAYQPHHSDRLPAATVVSAARFKNYGWKAEVESHLSKLPKRNELAGLGAGLTLLSLTFARCALYHRSNLNDGAASLLVPLLIHAWHIGSGEARADAAFLLASAARRASGSERAELSAWITHLMAGDTGLFALEVFEAATALGLTEHVGDAGAVSRQIEACLARPNDPLSRSVAYGIYSAQFEDVVGPEHWEAIALLEPEKRVDLLAMAALATNDIGSYWIDTCLTDVLANPLASTRPLAREAVEYCSAPPDKRSLFFDGIGVRVFCLGSLGRSLVGLPPRVADPDSDSDAIAWSLWGTTLYWTAVPNLSSTERRQRTAASWSRLLEDPFDGICRLYWIESALDRVRFPTRMFCRLWLEDIAVMAARVAVDLDRLKGTFLMPDDRVAEFAVAVVAMLPAHTARPLLEAVADRRDVGPSVIRLLKTLG